MLVMSTITICCHNIPLCDRLKTKGLNLSSVIHNLSKERLVSHNCVETFVHETFDMSLPSVHSIQSWHSNVPADPELTGASFTSLQARAQEKHKEGKQLVCWMRCPFRYLSIENAEGKYGGNVDVSGGITLVETMPVAN